MRDRRLVTKRLPWTMDANMRQWSIWFREAEQINRQVKVGAQNYQELSRIIFNAISWD